VSWVRNVLGALVVGVGLLGPLPVAAAAPGDCPAITRPAVTGQLPPAGQRACKDLRGLDLLQARLAGADLHGSNLAGVRLAQADLAGADLRGADLRETEMGQADLTGANLQGANLTRANLTQVTLTDADLRGAVLTDATAIQVVLDGADLRGADLRGVLMPQASLDGTDLRDADVTGAGLSQAETGNAIGLPVPLPNGTRDDGLVVNSDVDPLPDEVADSDTQIAYVLLWPAAAIVLLWWRSGIGYMLRHRRTTPLSPVAVVGGIVGVPLVMTGLYLAAVAAFRGIAASAGGASWTTDPGPFEFLTTQPSYQFAYAGGAFVLGVVILRATRRRWPATERRPAGSSATIGKPTPAPTGTELNGFVRGFVRALAYAGLIDIGAVVVLLVLDELPATGLWGSATVGGHLGFVAIVMLLLFGSTFRARTGTGVVTPSGVVLMGGGREPYLWLSGTSADKRPAGQALPWDALEQIHFIRTLGTTDPGAAMITVRGPGSAQPTEYPAEMSVTPDQVAALRALLPSGMFTEHTRAPSSDG
jgi:hypothetical protein